MNAVGYKQGEELRKLSPESKGLVPISERMNISKVHNLR